MLTDEKFAALCHALLFEEHGISYKPVAGDGGDSGIDGFVNDYEIIYQFKFFKSRPRPASFVNDINKVAVQPNLKQWVLILPEDPTLRLHQLIAEEKATRSFNVEALGKTWILSKLDKHVHIKERFFPEIAKEVSVQKVISLGAFAANKHEKLMEELKREVRSKKPVRISVEKPTDSMTSEHIRLIKDEIKKIDKATSGKYSFGKICTNLKNKYRVDNWLLIKDEHSPEIMDWLRRYYFGTRQENYKSPGQTRNQLIGIIKSQQKMLKLTDKVYREYLFKLTGKSSSTKMEIQELEKVKQYFNILLGLQT